MLQNITAALKEGLETSFIVSEEMSEEMSEEIDVKLAPPENAILRLLTEKPELTARALAEILGISARTVERHLQGLQAKGRLIRIGAKKVEAGWLSRTSRHDVPLSVQLHYLQFHLLLLNAARSFSLMPSSVITQSIFSIGSTG